MDNIDLEQELVDILNYEILRELIIQSTKEIDELLLAICFLKASGQAYDAYMIYQILQASTKSA